MPSLAGDEIEEEGLSGLNQWDSGLLDHVEEYFRPWSLQR